MMDECFTIEGAVATLLGIVVLSIIAWFLSMKMK